MRKTSLAALFAAMLAMLSALAQAQELRVLHTFNGTDGDQPSAGLVQASDGNFYGTTTYGGTGNRGIVFQITPSGKLMTLHNFAGSDGEYPSAGLLQASNGYLYGTTSQGGTNNAGTVFKITLAGGFTKIYDFCSAGNCGDGAQPLAGLVQGIDGDLYGTTSQGGTGRGGTIFKMSLNGSIFTLYNFCSVSNCRDGFSPQAGLVQGADGAFYGTALMGGTSNQCQEGCGTVFKLTPGVGLTTLHSFVATDGAGPAASLVQATDGNFYGTTSYGSNNNLGTVFKITPQGSLYTLHSFNSSDGANPLAALVQATDGNFYGTANAGGAANLGVIFSITTAGVYRTLHSFSGDDGGNPLASLVQGSDGNFYGTTYYDAMYSSGTVFSFSTGGLQFVPVTPCRVVDTRNADGPFGGPFISGNSSRDFPVPQGSCNIPSTASAYSLNATVVPHGSLGFVTVWPTGFPPPLVSTMNSYDGRVKADAVIMPAGANGGVSVFATDNTDVVLDINGYFLAPGSFNLAPPPAQAYKYFPVAPCRVVDTRNPNGPLGGPYIQGKNSREFPVQTSNCGLPNSAIAYSMNFTAVPHGSLGFLTVWPSDQQQPYVSTLNAYSGGAVANAAIVPAAKNNGDISAYVSDDSDLIIDVNGYFGSFDPQNQTPLSLYPLIPCRALDTRPNAFKNELTVNVKGSACSVPTAAQAYVFNATVVPPGPLGYLTLWADTQQQPGVSTLNAYDGAVTSNMAIVPTVNGLIDAFASDATNLLLDITSYFAP